MSQFDNLNPNAQSILIKQRPELQALNPNVPIDITNEQYVVEMEKKKQEQRSGELSKQVLKNRLNDLVSDFKASHKGDLTDINAKVKEITSKFESEHYNELHSEEVAQKMYQDALKKDAERVSAIDTIMKDPYIRASLGYDSETGRQYGSIEKWQIYDTVKQKYPDLAWAWPSEKASPTDMSKYGLNDMAIRLESGAYKNNTSAYGNVTSAVNQLDSYTHNINAQKSALSAAEKDMDNAKSVEDFNAASKRYDTILSDLKKYATKTDLTKITTWSQPVIREQGLMTEVIKNEAGEVISVRPNIRPMGTAAEVNVKYMSENGVVGEKWYQTPGQAVSAGIMTGREGNAQYVNDLMKNVKDKLYVHDTSGANILNPKLSKTEKQELFKELSAYESLTDYMYRQDTEKKAEKEYTENPTAEHLSKYISSKAALDRNVNIKDIPLITQSAMNYVDRGFTVDQAISKSENAINALNYKIDLFNTGNNKLIVPNMKHVESISDLISTPQKIVNAKEEIDYKQKIANGILSEITINSQKTNMEAAGAVPLGDNVLNAKYIDTKHRFIPDLNTATYRFGFNEFGHTLDNVYGDGTAGTVLNPKMGSQWTYNGDYQYQDGRVVSRCISNKRDIVDFGEQGVFSTKRVGVTGGTGPGGYTEWISRNNQIVGNPFGSNLVQSSYKDIKTGEIITGPPTDFSLVRSSGESLPTKISGVSIPATQKSETVKAMYENLADQMMKSNIKEPKELSFMKGVYAAPKIEINNISDLVTSGRMDTAEYKQSFLAKLPSELRNIEFNEVYSIPTQETLNTPLAGREWKEIPSIPGVYTTPLGKIETERTGLPSPYISNLGLLRFNDITSGRVPNTQENRDFVVKNLPREYNIPSPMIMPKEKGISGSKLSLADQMYNYLEENKDTDFTKNTVMGANKPELISGGFGPAVALLGAAKMYDQYVVSPIDTIIRGYNKSTGEEAPPESPITTARSFAASSVSSLAAIPSFPIHVAFEPTETIKGLTIGQYESFQKRPFDTTADILGMVFGSRYVVKGGSKSVELTTKGTGLVKEMIYPNPGSMMRTPGQLSELNTKLGGSIVRDMFEIKGDMEFTRGEKNYYPGPSMKLGSAVKEPTTIPGTFAAINVEPGTAYASPFTEGVRSPTGEIIRAPDAHYNIINAHTLYDIIPTELKNRVNERISRQEDFPKEAAEVEKYANDWSNAHNGKPVAVFTGKLTHYKEMGYAQLEPEVFLIIGDRFSPESLRYQRTFAGYNQYGVPLYKTFIYDIHGKIPIEKSSVSKNLFENIKYNLQEGQHVRNVHEKNVLENFDEQFGLKPSYGEYKYIGNSPEFHTKYVEQTLLSMPEAKIYNTNILRAAALIHDLAQIKPKGELEPYNTPHGEVVGNMLLQGKLDSRLAQIGISKLTQAEKIEVAKAITLHDVIEPSTSGRYYKIAKTKIIDRPSPLAKMLITADRLNIERFPKKTYNPKLGYYIPSIPKTKGGEPLYGFGIQYKLSNMANSIGNYFGESKSLRTAATTFPKEIGNKQVNIQLYKNIQESTSLYKGAEPPTKNVKEPVKVPKEPTKETTTETLESNINEEFAPKQFKDIYKYDKIYNVNLKRAPPNYYIAFKPQNKQYPYMGEYKTPKKTVYNIPYKTPTKTTTTYNMPTTYNPPTYKTPPTTPTTYTPPTYNPPTYNPPTYNPPTTPTTYTPPTYNPPQHPPTNPPPVTPPKNPPPPPIVPPKIITPPKITEKNEKLFWKKRKKAKIIQVTTEEPILSGYQILTGENLPHQYGKYEEYNWKPPKVSKYIAKKGKTSTFKKRLQPEALVNKTMKKNGFNIPNTWGYNKAINKFGVSLPKTKDTYPIKKLKSKKK